MPGRVRRCCVVLAIVIGIGSTVTPVAAETQDWTVNPGLARDQGGWWARAFRWDSLTGRTWDPVPNDSHDYGIWVGDGLVRLGAHDTSRWNTVNDAAWVTQDGPPLAVADLPAVTLTGRVSGSGTTSSWLGGWTGIKFDVWLRDTTRGGRLLYIEMYFSRTGLNHMWCYDLFRLEDNCRDELVRHLTLGTIDDYILFLPAFQGSSCLFGRCLPDLADIVRNADGSTTYRVDLKGVMERGARYFGRDLVGYELVTVGATLESGVILLGRAGRVWTDVNELRVTYEMG